MASAQMANPSAGHGQAQMLLCCMVVNPDGSVASAGPVGQLPQGSQQGSQGDASTGGQHMAGYHQQDPSQGYAQQMPTQGVPQQSWSQQGGYGSAQNGYVVAQQGMQSGMQQSAGGWQASAPYGQSGTAAVGYSGMTGVMPMQMSQIDAYNPSLHGLAGQHTQGMGYDMMNNQGFMAYGGSQKGKGGPKGVKGQLSGGAYANSFAMNAQEKDWGSLRRGAGPSGRGDASWGAGSAANARAAAGERAAAGPSGASDNWRADMDANKAKSSDFSILGSTSGFGPGLLKGGDFGSRGATSNSSSTRSSSMGRTGVRPKPSPLPESAQGMEWLNLLDSESPKASSSSAARASDLRDLRLKFEKSVVTEQKVRSEENDWAQAVPDEELEWHAEAAEAAKVAQEAVRPPSPPPIVDTFAAIAQAKKDAEKRAAAERLAERDAERRRTAEQWKSDKGLEQQQLQALQSRSVKEFTPGMQATQPAKPADAEAYREKLAAEARLERQRDLEQIRRRDQQDAERDAERREKLRAKQQNKERAAASTAQKAVVEGEIGEGAAAAVRAVTVENEGPTSKASDAKEDKVMEATAEKDVSKAELDAAPYYEAHKEAQRRVEMRVEQTDLEASQTAERAAAEPNGTGMRHCEGKDSEAKAAPRQPAPAPPKPLIVPRGVPAVQKNDDEPAKFAADDFPGLGGPAKPKSAPKKSAWGPKSKPAQA